MTTKQYIEKYKEWESKLSAYEFALTAISFDGRTVAPKGGSEFRHNVDAYLAGVYFSLLTDEDMIATLDKMNELDDIDEDIARAVKYRLKAINNVRDIPQDEFVKFQKLVSDSVDAWEKAKNEDNYSHYAPHLKKVIGASMKLTSYRRDNIAPYDMLLDDYEMGMTMDKYDEFFAKIKSDLVPLILKIKDRQNEVDTSFLNNKFPIEKQKEFMKQIMVYVNFDKEWGYLSESAHPFSTMFSLNDVRITTRYLEDNLPSSIFSIIHEIGHATYSHQVDSKYEGTYLSDCMTSGMHESQSRLLENFIGRTLEFWKPNYPKLQELFPEQLKDVSVEMFVRAINASTPSLIRTEADELTYPIHIYIRYELERRIVAEDIDLDNLDKEWDRMYQENLGISATNHVEGIMQDIHWSGASFGYFPTYALGSAYSAQFMNAMRKDIDVEKCLENNEFSKITDWLKEKIHKHGGFYTPEEIMVMATGEPFNPQYYIDYLVDKYSKLYNIK